MDNPSTNPARRRRRRRPSQGSGQNPSNQTHSQAQQEGGPRKKTSSGGSRTRKGPAGGPQARNSGNRGKRGGNPSRNQNRDRSAKGSGNRSRNRSGSQRSAQPSPWERFLAFISFGLLGKPGKSGSGAKGSQRPKAKGSHGKSAKKSAKGPRRSVEEPAFSPAKRHESASTACVDEEVTTSRLYVGNLSYDATEDQLEDLFRGVGNVIAAEVATDTRTQQSKGFAYIEMGSVDEARRAVETLDNQEFLGRRIEVTGSSETEDEAPEDSSATAASA